LPLAIAAYQEAIRLDPTNAKAHWNLAHSYLLQGDFARGWPEHEWRGPAGEVEFDHYTQPRWDGSPLAGKSLVVFGEQGLGDEVMFASCYEELVDQAGECIFVCDPRLVALLGRSFPRAKVFGHRRRRDRAPFAVEQRVDWQIAAGSLPMYLRRKAVDFPGRRSYLLPDAAAVNQWKQRFARLGHGLKIGISWRAGGRPSERQRRTTELADWRPLFALPGIQWMNLQYGHVGEDLAVAKKDLGITIYDFAEGDPLVDLDQFAAKVAALDLVISVGNATLHLAGALGVPGWGILPLVPGWRWQIAGPTSPWYPSVRLYRQQLAERWDDVFRHLRANLEWVQSSGEVDLPPEKMLVDPPSVGEPATARSAAARPGQLPNRPLLSRSADAGDFVERDLPAALDKAVAYHQAGALNQAEEIYVEVLQHVPRNVDAQRLLGILARQTGRVPLALTALRRALAAGDEQPETRIHLAGSLRDAGKLEAARAELVAAVECFPESAEVHFELGRTLVSLYRPDEATEQFETALRLDPGLIDAYRALADVLLEDGLAGEALAMCNRALAKRPNSASMLGTRAAVLKKLNRSEEAADDLAAAVAIEPEDFDLQFTLAGTYLASARLADAERAFRRALQLRPRDAATLNNLAIALQQQGQMEAALAMYDRAIEIDGNLALAHANRARLWIQQRRFCAGWYEYRWRWQPPVGPGPRNFFAQPQWAGESLVGRSILVHGEQELEDEIVFAGCLPDLVGRAGQVVVICSTELAPLFARSFPETQVFGVERGTERLWRAPQGLRVDVQIAAGDVPEYLRPDFQSFPERSSYLRADTSRVEFWRERLAQLGPGPKVGIAWRSGSTPLDRAVHWAPLAHWQPLLAGRGAQFISLQAGDCSREIDECGATGAGLHVLSDRRVFENIDERAALISALDLVVAVEDVCLHLAGALGTPAWAVLRRWPQWRWPLESERTPWYSAVRILRQTDDGDWTELFERAAENFLKWTANRADRTWKRRNLGQPIATAQ
jgi:tetratricopeptide (TPR) repeat protein